MQFKKTALILGAGASNSFNYPLGSQLKRQILGSISVNKNIIAKAEYLEDIPDGYPIRTHEDRIRYLVKRCGFKLGDILKFRSHFETSPCKSIDAFLENRPEFLELGKTLIALAIMSCESETHLFNDDYHNAENWYKFLFNTWFRGWLSGGFDGLSVITYNYDRSLEYFLVRSLMATFGKDTVDCLEIVDNIPIVHVHGKLSGYPGDGESGSYDNNLLPEFVDKARQNLHVIFEEEKVVEAYHRVHEILNEAERIFIVGFGFDERNLIRLRVENYRGKIYSTRFGLTDLQLQELNKATDNSIVFGSNQQQDIVSFFMNEVSFGGQESKHLHTFNGPLRYIKPKSMDEVLDDMSRSLESEDDLSRLFPTNS